jgi:hypothetical protein
MTSEEELLIRDSCTSQGGAAGAGDPLAGGGGATNTAGDLLFPRTQVRPYGLIRSANAVGIGKPHGPLEVSVLLGSPARPAEDTNTVWNEVGSLGIVASASSPLAVCFASIPATCPGAAAHFGPIRSCSGTVP